MTRRLLAAPLRNRVQGLRYLEHFDLARGGYWGKPSPKWYPDYTRFVQLKGLRDFSQATYLGWCGDLAAHYPAEPVPRRSKSKALAFLAHLQVERKLKGNPLKQVLCASFCFSARGANPRRSFLNPSHFPVSSAAAR